MGATAFLTAWKISPNKGTALPVPRVVQVPESILGAIITNQKDGGCVIKGVDSARKAYQYFVRENQEQVSVAFDPSTANVYGLDKALTVAAAGTTQGAATAITAYLNVVTTATGGSATGVRLPALAGVTKPFVVINNTAVALVLYPATGETINGGAANAGIAVAPGQRIHITRRTATDWVVALQ